MELPKPSTYTPFLRRFTNEREREFTETRQLYEWVKHHQDRFQETKETIGGRVYDRLKTLPEAVVLPLIYAMYDLLTAEQYMWELPPPDLERMSAEEFVDYRNLLYKKQYFFLNQGRLLDLLHKTLMRVVYGLGAELPDLEDPSPFTIPFIYALPDPKSVVERVYATLFDQELADARMFRAVAFQFGRNLCEMTGQEVGKPLNRPLKHATDSTLPLDEIAKQYLRDTPFLEVFNTPVPLKLTRNDRMNHMHIVGGTGAGKTTLIENLILHDLASDDPPSLVVIDPHGDMLDRLLRADLGFEDRLIYINPRDIEHPPALNVFALNRERMTHYDEATREQVMASAIQTFDYLFEGLGAEVTAKQSVFFRYVIRLMLSFPETMGRNATILDMMKLMQDPVPYGRAIQGLSGTAREFFLHDFSNKTFAQTKEQIRYRLQAILQTPTMERLLTAPETKIDLFGALNSGSIILVDTAKEFLKDGSATFGKFFISLVLQAVMERTVIPEHQRKDTFLIVDEAADYFSSDINDILNETRKYRCGLILAHHYLGEAAHGLQSSLATNTGAKFVSQVSAQDARAFASDMRTTADFILGQPKLQFAAHIRNVTPQAVSIPIAPRQPLPQRPASFYDAMIHRNRGRVSLGSRDRGTGRRGEPPPPPSDHPTPNAHPGDDIAPIGKISRCT